MSTHTFFPISPTKEAWEARLFKHPRYSLQGVLDGVKEELKEKGWSKMILPGQVYLWDDDGEKCSYDGPLYRFSGLRDLERVLAEELKDKHDRIYRIWFYQVGWWQFPQPAKKA